MKSIDFIFIGQAKNKSFASLEEEYHTRIKRYSDSRLIFLKDSSEKNIQQKNKKETEAIFDKTSSKDFIILCDEHGKNMNSVKLSKKILEWRMNNQRTVFVIGGAYGFDESLYKRANLQIKLSDFTLPHELARVVLLEQVYRSFTLIAGEKYHH